MFAFWEYLLIATGFSGAFTLLFLFRKVYQWFHTPFTATVYHSPKGGCTEAVVAEINRARKEVLMQAYSFTSKPIADALIAAKGRGVHVDILLDKSNEAETHTELGVLLEKGMAPHIDSHHAIAHNKIMIVDRRVLITGSFNFTNQAEHENAENLLIIRGNRELLDSYHQSFMNHKAHSQAPGAKAAATAAKTTNAPPARKAA